MQHSRFECDLSHADQHVEVVTADVFGAITVEDVRQQRNEERVWVNVVVLELG